MSKFIEADKLLAEIKELLKTAENEEKKAFAKLDAEGHLVAVTKTAICTKIVGFINSLQQEQPSIPSNLDEAAEKNFETMEVLEHENIFEETHRKIFKAGAEWQIEQFEKNRLAACDAQTKEEYDMETAFVDKIIKEQHRTPTFSDAIKYGIEWMAGQGLNAKKEVEL